MKRLVKKFIRNEDGQALPLVALLMVVLMGFAALVIDVGRIYNVKSEMQKAADAAALAGAQELPTASTAISTAKNYAGLNGAEKTNTSVTTPYKGDSNKIEVVCTMNVQYTFARFLGLTDADVSARAVAQKISKWNGDALPFINLDFDYSTTDPIAWTKVGPGIKGTLTDFYTRNSDSDDPYFELDYTDGLTVTPGFSNGTKGLDNTKLSDGLAKVLTPADMGIKKVYLFSLRSEIIQGRTFTVNNKTKTVSLDKLNKLNNGDVIDPDQLVLIECQFDNYKWSNQHDIELTYLNKVYDLGNKHTGYPNLPDYPEDYVGPNGSGTKLVE
ncbi:putative Flp pilus-assembly TadE/G-like protein [anaerobic digester metagenome]